jgi:membrane associated rhomboid family serine protease
VKEGRTPATERLQRQLRGQNVLATKIIIAINVIAFVVISIRDQRVDGLGRTSADLALFGPSVHAGEWWRLASTSVVHYGVLHLLFNMLLLWVIGQMLEPGAGPLRFTMIYVVSVLAGSAGALIATPHVYSGGASGGVMGLAGAAYLVLRRQGVSFWNTGFGPLIVIVLIQPLFISNISSGAHIGGLIGGALATESMMEARKAGHPALGLLGAAFVGVAAVLLSFAVAGN